MSKGFRVAVMWGNGSIKWKHFSTEEKARAYSPDEGFLGFPRVEDIQVRHGDKWVSLSKGGE